MSQMTLGGIRSFVRTSLDTDADELPDTLLNVFVEEAFDHAMNSSNQWSFYATVNTISTAAGTQAYDFGSATPHAGIAQPLQSIVDVRGDNFTLANLSHQTVRASMRRTSPSSARPWGWSEHGTSLYLWPIPDSVYTLEIAGYREPLDWMAGGDGAIPDCPSEFHRPIAYYALARGWAQQSDPDMAAFYSSRFDVELSRLKARYATSAGMGPHVLNGGLGIDSYTRNGLGPLIYPFN